MGRLLASLLTRLATRCAALAVVAALSGGVRLAAAPHHEAPHRCGCPAVLHDCDCPQCHALGLARGPSRPAGPCLEAGCGASGERFAALDSGASPFTLGEAPSLPAPGASGQVPERAAAATDVTRAPETPPPRPA